MHTELSEIQTNSLIFGTVLPLKSIFIFLSFVNCFFFKKIYFKISFKKKIHFKNKY